MKVEGQATVKMISGPALQRHLQDNDVVIMAQVFVVNSENGKRVFDHHACLGRLKPASSLPSMPCSQETRKAERMDHNEAGFEVPPEAPSLCVNNCGFFGTTATMNMCSKCHKDLMLKEEQAKLAASSIGSIVNGSSAKELGVPSTVRELAGSPESWALATQPSCASITIVGSEKIKEDAGPSRCSTCGKRVGLTGFSCRCGNLFCSLHRYSDKHECPFDYRMTARDAIAKANPVVKAQKLDKI